MSKPIAATPGSRRAAVRERAVLTGSPRSPPRALGARETSRTRRRTARAAGRPRSRAARPRGDQLADRVVPQHVVEVERRARPAPTAAASSSRSASAAAVTSAACSSGTTATAPVERRRRSARSLARSSAPCPASIFFGHRVAPGQVRVGERLDGERPQRRPRPAGSSRASRSVVGRRHPVPARGSPSGPRHDHVTARARRGPRGRRRRRSARARRRRPWPGSHRRRRSADILDRETPFGDRGRHGGLGRGRRCRPRRYRRRCGLRRGRRVWLECGRRGSGSGLGAHRFVIPDHGGLTPPWAVRAWVVRPSVRMRPSRSLSILVVGRRGCRERAKLMARQPGLRSR